MYIPKLNEETRVEVLHGLMAAHPLATLVTVGAKGLIERIGRMEGKWKLDQGESERNRVGVVKGLEAVGTPESLAMKGLVEKTLVSE